MGEAHGRASSRWEVLHSQGHQYVVPMATPAAAATSASVTPKEKPPRSNIPWPL